MVSAMNCKYYPRLLLHMLRKEKLKCDRVELKDIFNLFSKQTQELNLKTYQNDKQKHLFV